MTIISKIRCRIGEGPIWNEKEKRLYQVNPFDEEILRIDIDSCSVERIKPPVRVSAIAFDSDYRMLISTPDGVFRLTDALECEPIYDTERYSLKYCNDMKVGPDGRLYVGTQSGKRKGVSDKIDGKLYSIDKSGEVRILLDKLILSNGLDWSCDRRRFYHTDSDTAMIREYDFNGGEISFTGREVRVDGVDGFTIDRSDRIIAACWGRSHLAVVDTLTMKLVEYIEIPAKIPASCGFAGEDMSSLITVTANYDVDLEKDKNAGFTFLDRREIGGKPPYLFGKNYI